MSFVLKHDGNCAGDLVIDGTLNLKETSAGSGNVKIQAPDTLASGDYTLTLPDTDGDTGQVLKTDGSGVLSWGSAVAGSDTHIQFNGSGIAAGSSNLTWDGSKIGVIGDVSTDGLILKDLDNSNTVTLKAPDVIASDYTLVLPDTDGEADQVLKTDGSGVLSWTVAGGVAGNDNEIQFNESGVASASPDLTWNGTDFTIATSKYFKLGTGFNMRASGSGMSMTQTSGTTLLFSNSTVNGDIVHRLGGSTIASSFQLQRPGTFDNIIWNINPLISHFGNTVAASTGIPSLIEDLSESAHTYIRSIERYKENYVLVCGASNTGTMGFFSVFDVTSRRHPVKLSSITVTSGGARKVIVTEDNKVFLVTYTATPGRSIVEMNMTDLAAPVEGTDTNFDTELPLTWNGIRRHKYYYDETNKVNYLYLNTTTSFIHLINLDSMTHVGSQTDADFAYFTIRSKTKQIFGSSGDSTVAYFDISTPTDIGSYSSGGTFLMTGNIRYLECGNNDNYIGCYSTSSNGLYVKDISVDYTQPAYGKSGGNFADTTFLRFYKDQMVSGGVASSNGNLIISHFDRDNNQFNISGFYDPSVKTPYDGLFIDGYLFVCIHDTTGGGLMTFTVPKMETGSIVCSDVDAFVVSSKKIYTDRLTIGQSAIVSSGDYTLTLPIDSGTVDQFLKTDGNGVLSWGDAAAGGAQTSLVLEDPGVGTNTVTIQPPTLSGDYTLTLPVDGGTVDQVLKSNGGGVLSWGDAAAGGGDSGWSATDLSTGLLYSKIDTYIGYWVGVVWAAGLGLFVAVSSNNPSYVQTSPDGITWTTRTGLLSFQGWSDLAWSQDLTLLVAISTNNPERIMTSPDGINWTGRTISDNNSWQSITWASGIGLFVAVSSNGTNRVITSPDGIVWTGRTAASASSWHCVAWSPDISLLVATGSGGEVMTSSDGINWTSRTPAETNNWSSIVWASGLGLFVAVSYNGTNRVMTSPDGIAWTSRTTAGANDWESVAWSEEEGILVAVSNDKFIEMSTDSINWYPVISDGIAPWKSITWSPEVGRFVIVSNVNGICGILDISLKYNKGFVSTNISLENNNGQIGLKIPDDITENYDLTLPENSGVYGNTLSLTKNGKFEWKEPNVMENKNVKIGPTEFSNTYGIVWSSTLGLFVAVGNSGKIQTSPNGVIWTERTSGVTESLRDISWSPELGIFVVIKQSGTDRILTSPDGINWTSRTPPEETTFYSIVWSPTVGLFVTVSSNGTDRVQTSPDGINWTGRTAAAANSWRNVTWSKELGLFVATAYAASSNHIMTSPDGINWTGRTSPNNLIADIAWSPKLGLFVVCSAAGSDDFVTSPDGINWTIRTVQHEGSYWNKVIWSEFLEEFLCVSSKQKGLISSPDGINWESREEMNRLNCIVESLSLNIIVAMSIDPLYLILDNNVVCESRFKAKIIGISDDSSNVIELKANSVSDNYALTLPVDGGRSDQILKTDGTGVLSWTTDHFEEEPRSFNVSLSSGSLQSNAWWSVYWVSDISKFITISTTGSNRIAISSDGITWEAKSSGSYGWRDVTWSGSLSRFIVVGTSVGNSIGYSDDNGDTWIIVTDTDLTANTFTKVIWVEELSLFIAAGTDIIATSPTGLTNTWTIQSTSSGNWKTLVWSPKLGYVVASAASGTNALMTSKDGITWTIQKTLAEIVDAKSSIAWSSELKLFCSVSNSEMATSLDGINWESHPRLGTHFWQTVIWTGEMFLAVANKSSVTDNVAYSYDGKNWAQLDNITLNESFRGIGWSPELNKAVSTNYNKITIIDINKVVNQHGILKSNQLKIANKGSVTQVTSATTSVRVNSSTGKITTVSLDTLAGVSVSFTVNDSFCSAESVVLCNVSEYSGTGFVHCSVNNVSDGSFDVIIINSSASSLDATCTLSFMIV